jgi:hypothetical protein
MHTLPMASGQTAWAGKATRFSYPKTCRLCHCRKAWWPITTCSSTLIPSRQWFNHSYPGKIPLGLGSQMLGMLHMAALALARGEGFQVHAYTCPEPMRSQHPFCWFAPVSRCGDRAVEVCSEEGPRRHCLAAIDDYIGSQAYRDAAAARPIPTLERMCSILHRETSPKSSTNGGRCAQNPLRFWRALARMIFQLQPEIEAQVNSRHLSTLPWAQERGSSGYGAVHVRRGDKTRNGGEAKAVQVCRYADALATLLNHEQRGTGKIHGRHVFVATDEPEVVVPRFRKCASTLAANWTVHAFHGRPGRGQSREVMVRLWAELTLLRHATVFVGTATSNVARLVQLLRYQHENTFVSLDNGCPACPRGTGFCPEPALRWMCLLLEGWVCKDLRRPYDCQPPRPK